MLESPYELAPRVVVRTFTYPWEAELAQAQLQSEGIDASVGDANTVRMDWMISNALGGVKLLVPSEEAERALEILAREVPLSKLYLVDPEEKSPLRCPGCRSDELYLERWSRVSFLLGAVLLGFPFPLPRRRWVCRSCRATWRGFEVERSTPSAINPELAGTAREALVPIATFDRPWEAELASHRLGAQGIDAYVSDDRLPGVNLWSGHATAASRLEVRASDAARALEILAESPDEDFSDESDFVRETP